MPQKTRHNKRKHHKRKHHKKHHKRTRKNTQKQFKPLKCSPKTRMRF